MGNYVNPPDRTKEQWLQENALQVVAVDFKYTENKGVIGLCLVDNGWMTACAVCDSESEHEMWRNLNDGRPKRLFLAPIEKVSEVMGDWWVNEYAATYTKRE